MTRREEELIAEGWERRFISSEPRLSEVVAMYEEIGFEVHLEPLPSKEEREVLNCEADGCTVCFDVDPEKYRIIFTRSKHS